MSTEIIKQIISRAVVETEFRELLFAEPIKALTGYELTDEERAIFQNLSPTEFDALAGNLEERISRTIQDRSATWCGTAHCSGACGSNAVCGD